VLVLGVYLANRPSHIDSLVSKLSSPISHRVVQQWISLEGPASNPQLQNVTRWHQPTLAPKFLLINQLLSHEHLQDYEYLVVIDDDVQLPSNFLSRFLTAQAALDFRLAQPARTPNSYIQHPIVTQQSGTFARQTRWVEVGPVFSIHHSLFDVILPFDERSPMGWGYENVWAYELSRRGLKMGIIDAFPVDHSLRSPNVHYSWKEADANRRRLLDSRPHLSQKDCQQVLAEFENAPAPKDAPKAAHRVERPANERQLSVVVACREGSDAQMTLASLARQTFLDFDLIVSHDQNRGANWARNRGFELVKTPFVLFSDDDIMWEPGALESMKAALDENPEVSYAYGSYSIPEIGTQCDVPFDAGCLRRNNFISTMSLVRTSHFPGFDESIQRFQDWDVWLTMLERGQTGVYCGSHIFETRFRRGITYGGQVNAEEAIQIIKKKHNLP
jgi:hypothetical protein